MPFPLVRYLENVIAIHSYCDVFLKYAHSPRLRRYFYNKVFRVNHVQIEPNKIVMPQSWDAVIKKALDRQEFVVADHGSALMQTVFVVLKDFPNPVQARIDCECFDRPFSTHVEITDPHWII